MCILCISNPLVDWHALDLVPMELGTASGGARNGTPVGFNAALVNQLNSDSYWYNADGTVARTLSYGFTTSSSFATGSTEAAGWSTFTNAQKIATREIMSLWDDLIKPSITELTGSPNTADIKFSNSTTDTVYANGYYPGAVGNETYFDDKISGSIWLNPAYNSGTNSLVTPVSSAYGYMAIMHEIGHTLGLDHGGTYNGGSPIYGNTATGWLYAEDSRQFTIMSYFNSSSTGANWSGKYAQTPMVYDIMAIQQLYGADYTTRAGNTTYGFNSNAGGSVYNFSQNTSPILTIWDGNGIDTIDLSGWFTASTLNLAAGSYSSVNGMTNNLAIAYDVDIENATGGAGNDIITGNDLGNILIGNGGADTLNGAGGDDTINGGAGDDRLNGDAGNDTLIGGGHSVGGWNTLVGGAGIDTADYSAETGIVYADLSLSVGYIDNGSGSVFNDSLQQFENLIGGAGNDALSGDDTANVINGRGGNDVMFGKGGDDTMIGGGHLVGGYDVLYGDAGVDTVSFAGVTSQVYADLMCGSPFGVSYINSGLGFVHDSLLFAFENIIGGAGNDILQGDNNANILTGGDGADFMLGQGGNDTLIGGIGNDSLYGQDGNDRFVFDQGLDIATGGTGADTYFWNSMIQGADVVSDFSHAEGDKINLDHSGFGVSAGLTLAQGFSFLFGAGVTATNATATFAFDTTTAILWYDIDGTGASGQQAITFLSNGGGGITAGDIIFV